MPENRAQSTAIHRVPGRGMTDSDFPSISLINLTSHHRDLAARMDQDLSPLRWRCNIHVDGLMPRGKSSTGSVKQPADRPVLSSRSGTDRRAAWPPPPTPTPACATPTYSARSTPWDHQDFGVYAKVTRGGRVSTATRSRCCDATAFPVAEAPDAPMSEKGRVLFAGQTEFLKGVVAMSGPAPRRPGPKSALPGAPMSGKSTLINALTGRKGLARASNTPGRTQEINYFTLGRQPLSGRPARLWLCQCAAAGGRKMAKAAQVLPVRPPDPAPRLRAGRCAPRDQGRGRGNHGAARQRRRDFPMRPDQDRQGETRDSWTMS